MSNNEATIERAVQALRQESLVAFPTETVYGLGADAGSSVALQRLYRAKGRPTDHPVIVHLADAEQINDWAASVSPQAKALAAAFWPGPLTMILPRAAHVLDAVTGGQDTVGLRIPNHELALALLRSFGGGVAAPSANKFGRLSPTSAQDVATEFGDEVAMVLDGGPCDVGIESTIVDLSGDQPRILRPGMILAEHIEQVLGKSLARPGEKTPSVRVPGGLPSHYAPRTPVLLVESGKLEHTLEMQADSGKSVAVLRLTGIAHGAGIGHVGIGSGGSIGSGGGVASTLPSSNTIYAPAEPAAYARQLYRNLRALDHTKSDLIIVEQVPDTDGWSGIADRLTRAAADQLQMRGETA